MPSIDRWKLAQYKAARLDQAYQNLLMARKQKREEGYQDVEREQQKKQWDQLDILFGEHKEDRALNLSDKDLERKQLALLRPLDVQARQAQIAKETRPDSGQFTSGYDEAGNTAGFIIDLRAGKAKKISGYRPIMKGELTEKQRLDYRDKALHYLLVNDKNPISGLSVRGYTDAQLRQLAEETVNWIEQNGKEPPGFAEKAAQVAEKYQPLPQGWGVRSGGLLGGQGRGSGTPSAARAVKPQFRLD